METETETNMKIWMYIYIFHSCYVDYVVIFSLILLFFCVIDHYLPQQYIIMQTIMGWGPVPSTALIIITCA